MSFMQTFTVQCRRFELGTAFGGPIWTVAATSPEDAMARVRANCPADAETYEMRAGPGNNVYALPPWPTQSGSTQP